MVSEIQSVCSVCGDLDSLIATGTLLVTGLEAARYGYEGIAVDSAGWKWVDPWFLDTCIGSSASTHIRALSQLLRHRLFVATYKRASLKEVAALTKALHSAPSPVFRVRLYAVPNDVNGARFVKSWRSRLASEARIKKIYRSNWQILREVVDFSPASWNDLATGKLAIVPLISRSTKRVTHHESFHIQRWLDGSPCTTPSQTHQPSLESVVKRIYDNISPPDLSSYKDAQFLPPHGIPSSEETIKGLVNCYYKNQFPIHGVVSTLYPFQLSSVCKMYEKESIRQREIVPNYTKVVSPSGGIYYVNIFDMDFHKLPEMFLLPKGGILAENMGLGKTLICLSLICLTKHQFSVIPEDAILHDDQTLDGTINEKPIKLPHGLKSLWEICREEISQKSLPWKFYKDDLPASVVEKLSYYPGFFKLPLHVAQNQLGLRARHAMILEDRFRVLYLCNTSLVIVPENLFHQWHREMMKHLAPDYLKSLFVSDRFQEHMKTNNASYVNVLPSSPREMTQYDLVVMTIPSFQKWSRPEDSILRMIHWKRLIIDEGHTMGSRTTSLSNDCKALSCERVWAVTGTPTSGLTNLHMNEEEPVTASPSKKRKYTVKNSFIVKDDLARVSNLVSSFFKIEPYYSQPRLWSSIIVRYLTAENFSTEDSLKNLLNILLVRHTLADVEKDLQLPQLHHEAVFINPSYQNKLAINLFTAVLAVNAVSSEREGSDYMFEATNHQQLRKLVNNLQLATFYWTGFKQQDVETLLRIAEHCLKKEKPNGELHHSASDRDLLKKSIEVSTEALHNQRWRTAAALHEMLYYVKDVPPQFARHFGMVMGKSMSLFGAPHLSALQNFFYKNRFLNLADTEKVEARLSEISKPFWDRYWTEAEQKEGKARKRHAAGTDTEAAANSNLVDTNVDPEIEVLRGKQNVANERSIRSSQLSNGENAEKVFNIKDASISGTASSKLSYLATRLVENQRAGLKSIVFFEYEDSAYYLSEFLDIIGVKYILYATFIGASQRSNNLTEFDRHDVALDGGIALIMDLRLAAHGLTVISATRVYFMSPVWHRSREAQAIKRAHRIGQTREVYVETLVLRGTLEEEIYKHRAQNDDQSSRQEMIDDAGMQRFILKHEFLPTGSHEVEHAPFSIPAHEDNIQNVDDQLEETSLRTHTRKKSTYDGVLHHDWTLRLFTQDNLDKLNSMQQQKPTKAQSNKDLLSIDSVPKRVHSEPKTGGSKRRRVQFRQ